MSATLGIKMLKSLQLYYFYKIKLHIKFIDGFILGLHFSWYIIYYAMRYVFHSYLFEIDPEKHLNHNSSKRHHYFKVRFVKHHK